MLLLPVKHIWPSVLMTVLLLIAHGANADFYRFENEEGVMVFTNAPTSTAAVRIMKEELPKTKPAKTSFKTKKLLLEDNKPLALDQSSPKLHIPVSGRISSNYGWRHDPIDGNLKHHNGIDIAVASGTPIKSIAPGRVTFSGARGGYGNLVIIEHDNGVVSLYGHNSLLLASTGELVDGQSTIALSGSTGRSTGPHLHFELWKNGMNLTQAYVEDRSGSFKTTNVASSRVQHDEIRRFVEKNGTVVFTNLPQ